jgi:hypothetical protein
MRFLFAPLRAHALGTVFKLFIHFYLMAFSSSSILVSLRHGPFPDRGKYCAHTVSRNGTFRRLRYTGNFSDMMSGADESRPENPGMLSAVKQLLACERHQGTQGPR